MSSAPLSVRVCIRRIAQATAMFRFPIARSLALCDAAKISLPMLDVTLASGFLTVNQIAAEVSCGAADKFLFAPAAWNDLCAPPRRGLGVPTTATSLTQSRRLSSEESFRGYGRDFGNDETSTGGAATDEEAFADARMPEGMEGAEDGEEQESQDEIEMRLRLLESALKHVVCSAAPSSAHMRQSTGRLHVTWVPV